MKPPNLRHLNIALLVAKHHGFSAVSKIANLSPSAVTQAISNLESTLGVQIFDRTPAGVFPNVVGQIYLDRIARAFESLVAADGAIYGSKSDVKIKTNVTISQLRAVISVVQSGSYNLAAKRLGLSQPSVYKAANTLQALYQTELFRPSPQGIEPTHRAREFSRHASIGLSEIARGNEDILEHQGRMEGRIAIGALPLIRTRILPLAVTKLLAIYPNCQVEFVDGVYTDLLASLRHGRLDILLGALRATSSVRDIVQRELFSDKLSVIVRNGHPILKIKQPSFSDLTNLEWIVPRIHTPTRTYFNNLFPRHGYEIPKRIIQTGSLMAIRTLLLESNRAAILSARQAAHEIQNKELCVVNISLDGSSRSIGMTVRNNWKPTVVQRKFVNFLSTETNSLK